MTEGNTDGIDGEVLPPEPGEGKGKGTRKGKGKGTGDDKGDDKKAQPPGEHRTFGRTSKQNPQQRAEEEAGSKAFYGIVAAGGFHRTHGDWEPTQQQRDAVKMLKFCGYTDEDIAYATGMSVETLGKYFEFELKTAKMLVIGDLAQRAVIRARQGDATLTMFLLKTRGGQNFSERAIQMQALGEALDKEEPNDSRRAELVGKVLDLLDTHRKKSNQKQDEPEAKT